MVDLSTGYPQAKPSNFTGFVMTIWLVFWVAVAALCLSASVCLYVVSGRPKRHRHRALEDDVREIRADQTAATDELVKVHRFVKKINARQVMAERNEQKKSVDDADKLDDESWKREMQRRLALRKAGVSTNGD